ncbi:MAG: serine protein kinase RIO [Candidatus Altiarchaeota archaeon]|nr:serine protein kinase RIO [Candidatus Altiarchaeota archaeon]
MEKKTWGGVFDRPTLFTLQDLYHKRIFSDIGGEVASGKEARVFVAYNDTLIALKIYRIEAAVFENIWPYIRGDPRFYKLGKNRRRVISEWVKKEYRNLTRLHSAGVRVPIPLIFRKNVLAMEFIGDKGAARLLKDTGSVQGMFEIIFDYMIRSYQIAKLVHGDLSEYNIMVWKNKPVVIDVAQSVDIRHPMAQEFLERDIKNIHKFFSPEISQSEMLEKIIGVSD